MNAFAIVIVLMAALALLALIFSFIAVRGKNGPWGLFSALFSLGAGVLFAIWLGKTNSSLLGNFTQKEGILGTVADFAFTAVMTGLAHFALCSVIGGFIRPLMKNGKPNNPVWRLLLYAVYGAGHNTGRVFPVHKCNSPGARRRLRRRCGNDSHRYRISS